VPDESSIGPFYKAEDYISHTNTDKGFINQLYKKVRKVTLSQKANLVQKFTGREQGCLLDTGCGTGAFLHTMRERGWEISGIEPDDTARNLAKKLYGIEPLEAQKLYELPTGSLNAITMWHVLEHVHSLHEYVEQLKNLLAPGAKLFIAVPNYNSLDADIYRLHWAAYDVPRHLYHFTPMAMKKLMALHGLKVIAKKPMWFDAFYIAMLSSRYKSGNTNWISSAINGLRSNIKASINTDRCSSLIYIIEKA
jgi:2-polyprenyl-3-methyl-5-hydroxy-6-metoxy-1,4-benzoquinol methylase